MIRKITVLSKYGYLEIEILSLINSLTNRSNFCLKSYIYIYFDEQYCRKDRYLFYGIFSFLNEIKFVYRPYISRKTSFHWTRHDHGTRFPWYIAFT